MSRQATSKSSATWIEAAPVREVIIEETTTSNIYWDVGSEFEFSKYTEEDARLSHALFRMRADDGDAVGLIEFWAPRKVFDPDELGRAPDSRIHDLLGFQAEHAWAYEAVQCAPLDESDARLLEHSPGKSVVCIWRYYYDQDDDLLLGQRFVLTDGYAGFFRRPLLPVNDGEIKVCEETGLGGSAA
jgi:hypothetical protein